MKTGKVVMEQKSPGHEMLKTSTSCHCSAGSGLGNNSDEKDVSFFEAGPLCSFGTCQIPAFHKGMLKGQAEIGDYDKRDDAPC
jgi:hypothetical protein